MNFCTQCGAETKPGQKVCTQCGNRLIDDTHNEVSAQPSEPHTKQPESTKQVEYIESVQSSQHVDKKPVKKKQRSKKSIIPIIIGLLLLITLIAAYFIGNQMTDPNKHAEKIITAIKDKDYDQLKSLIESDNGNISTDEAKAYANLITTKGMTDQLESSLKEGVKSAQSSASMTPKVKVDDILLMTIAKQGKKLLFFDNYTYKVPLEKVTLYATEDGKLEFNLNNQTHKLNLIQDATNEFSLVTGLYDLNATKEVNDKSVKGTLLIDTTNDPQVEQQFEGLFIKVELTGDDNLDEGDTKIIVNGESVDYNPNKSTYGPFEGDSLDIHAVGELEGKNFESNSETISQSDLQDNNNTVSLAFDTDEIDSYIAEKNVPEPSLDDSSDDSDNEEDSSSDSGVIITSPDDALNAVRAYEDTSDLADPGQEIRRPVRNAVGFGFGIFEDGEVVKSYDVKLDGTVIEYDEDAQEVYRMNPYE